MKKILLSGGLAMLSPVLLAQNHIIQDVLAVSALATGTNLFGITNLVGVVTNAGMFHATNVVFTNLAGRVTRSNGTTTNAVSMAQLFKDFTLWQNREGGPAYTYGPFSGNPTINQTNYPVGYQTLFIRIASPQGSNAPIGINFAPLWDGENMPTRTADDWSVIVPGSEGAVITLATNIPNWKWPGAELVRVRTITNEFIKGGDAAITNSPYITQLRVVGFRP